MTAPFVIQTVSPLGSEVVRDLCTGRAREFLRYPESPRGDRLMLRRAGLSMSLRDAAAALGLTPAHLADLEQGRAVLASDAEWDRAEKALVEAASAPRVSYGR